MGGRRGRWIFSVFVICFFIVNCAPNVLSNDSEEEIANTGDDRSQFDATYSKKYVRKRSANGSDVYGLLAGISGGSVIHAGKDNISKAVDILSTVTLTSPVVVTRKQLRVNGIGQVPFYVDKSLTKLAFEIKTSCCKPTQILVTDPAGNNLTTTSANVTLKVDTSTLTYLMISRSFIPGNWLLTIYDAHKQDYDVTVHGSSVINFDQDFCDKMGITVSGSPIPDSNATYVKITPLGNDMVSNWTYLQIKSVNGTLLQNIPLGALRGSRSSKAFLVPVVWPNMDVRVGVLGQDVDGNTFTRDQETLVQPIGVRLKLNNSGEEFIHSCFKPLFVPFTITNTGSDGYFIVQAETDNKNFLARISPSVANISSHSSVNGHCDVTVISDPSLQPTTQVMISVVQFMNSTSKSQFITKTVITRGVTCSGPLTSRPVALSTAGSSTLNSSVTTTGGSGAPKIRFNSLLQVTTILLVLITVILDRFML